MKKYLLVILFVLSIKITFATHDEKIFTLFSNITLGYQTGYASNLNQSYLHAVDFNAVVLIPNFSVNYQFGMGWKIFGGVGLFDICQLQFGHSFRTNEFLIRIRSDWNLSNLSFCGFLSTGNDTMFSEKKIPTIGFFFENRMNRHGYQGFNIGITIALPIPYSKYCLVWYHD